MQFTGFRHRCAAATTFTLREVMRSRSRRRDPLPARNPERGWTTLASAAVRPKVFWLHWFVRRALRGVQMQVRFVLESGGQLLAVSPGYAMSVTA